MPRSLGRLLLGAFITASLSACIDIGPHAPLGPSLISGTVSPTCRPGTPLPPGRLFTDITEQAGLKGITGVRVAAADA